MITIDEILGAAQARRKATRQREHEHDLAEATFDIEGAAIRGKQCRVCGERFFLAEDVPKLEKLIQKRRALREVGDDDGVLLLLGAYPEVAMPGTLVFQKEAFLLEKSLAPDLGLAMEPLEFKPHRMGPYSDKLKRILAFRARAVLTTDPYVSTDPNLLPLDHVLEHSDLLVVGAPHQAYQNLATDKPIIDIWGSQGKGVKF